MYTIIAMEQTVTYDPERVLKKLRARYANYCPSRGDEDQQNLAVVEKVYREKGHSLVTGEAGGILQLFRTGKHVSNMLLHAAGLL